MKCMLLIGRSAERLKGSALLLDDEAMLPYEACQELILLSTLSGFGALPGRLRKA